MNNGRMRNKNIRRLVSGLLIFFIMLGSVCYMPSFSHAKAIRPKKIVMNKKTVRLETGDTFRLKVKKVSPNGASKAVVYSTSDKKVAAVSKAGLIKAVKEGKATITVRSKKAKKVKTKVKVTVSEAVSGSGNDQSGNSGKHNAGTITGDNSGNNNGTNNGTIPGTDTGKDPNQPGNPGDDVKTTASPMPDAPDNTADPVDPKRDGEVTLYKNGAFCAPIIIDRQYNVNDDDQYADRTYTQIMNAVTDLRQDVAMVSGAINYRDIQQIYEDSKGAEEERLNNADESMVPQILYEDEATGLPSGDADTADSANNNTTAIIIGTVKNSLLVRSIIKEGKLEEAKKIQDSWEGYVIKTVHDVRGYKDVLVIAGSDARGTIYGIYTLSEMIGVSPFYWFSDVPVETKNEIVVSFEKPIVDDGPDVKYRGIFINDEEKTVEWAKEKFPSDGWYTPGVHYYRKVFELLLRLKANTLWPAMHDVSRAFNLLTDKNGTPVNAAEAARYGIIMGTSHCEIMLRNNVGEWWGWFDENKDRYPNVAHMDNATKAYDFTLNKDLLVGYWTDRIKANKNFENILTLGLRGIHDEAFNCENLDAYEGSTDAEKRVSLMKDVINTQRDIVAKIYGKENVDKIPQVIIPYNEVNDIYNNGLNKFLMWDGSKDYNGDGVIDYKDDNTDIMIMWAEDNHNYLRQDLTEEEASRRGGAGIYYHISYWGPPQSYLWLNSTSIYTMSEQMHRGYNIGADDYWILNVGDIKPSEPSTEYFMKMAWDAKAWNEETADDYLTLQAQRDYGLNKEDARTMSECVSEYYQINGVRKAEFYSKAWFGNSAKGFSSYEHGDEALRWINRSNANTEKMTSLYNEKVRKIYRNTFYEQFYFNMLTLNDIIETFGYYEKNQLAGSQGRYMSSRIYAELSKNAQDQMIARVDEANALNSGKWNHIFEYDHPGRVYALLGDGNETYSYVNKPVAGVGAACENFKNAGSGTLYFNMLNKNEMHYIDIFSKNVSYEGWTSRIEGDWIKVSASDGYIRTEERIKVWINYDKLGDVLGTQKGKITIYDDYGNVAGEFVISVTVPAVILEDVKGYVCTNGYVAFEAEHYSENVKGEDGTYWALSGKTGQNGDTMKAMPDDAGFSGYSTKSGHLVYNVYFEQGGSYNFGLVRRPVLNEGSENGNDRSMGVAIRANDDRMVTLTGYRSSGNFDNIINMSETLKSSITVRQGWNKIGVYIGDASFVFDRMYIETEDGRVGNTILGPAESPNTFGGELSGGSYVMAEIPDEVLNYSRDEVVFGEIRSIRLGYGESTTIEIPAKSSNGAECLFAAKSDNTVVKASVEGNKITLTSIRPTGDVDGGSRSATITVTGVAEGCENGQTTFRVNTYDPDSGSIYVMNGETLTIDAADAINETYYSWTDTIMPNEWVRSGNGVKIIPDVGSKWSENELEFAPSINYRVNITSPGQYYLYVNMSSPDDNADSYHFAVDGKYIFTHNKGDLSGNGIWASTEQSFNLSYGEHIISVYAREDGFVANKIMLAKKLQTF